MLASKVAFKLSKCLLTSLNLTSRSKLFLSTGLRRTITPLSPRLDRSCRQTTPTFRSGMGSMAAEFSSSASVDQEMLSFLNEEITAEKSNLNKAMAIPGFEITKDGSCLRLKRGYKNEQITIRVDVNASTVEEEGPEVSGDSEYTSGPIMSKPDFAVEIRKPNGKVLCMTCRFVRNEDFGDGPEQIDQQANQQDPPKDDIFEVEAFTVVDSKEIDSDLEVADNVYLGDASLVDAQLYDLLMDYLDERGIGRDFSKSLIEYCTAYEHENYIELLDKLKNFVSA